MADVVEGRERWHVAHADCRFALACLPDACIDAIVCDPPYELTSGSGSGGFMGMRWDATGIAFDVALWREALRVLKPGGHLLACGGTRTYHRMTCAIEDAEFEIRDSLAWLHAQGFPKSLDPVKAAYATWGPWPNSDPEAYANAEAIVTTFCGYGTSLKPSFEPVVVARKALYSTVVENLLAHGTGALNIEATRVRIDPVADASQLRTMTRGKRAARNGWGMDVAETPGAPVVCAEGRWPPNVVFAHADGCRKVGEKRVRCDQPGNKNPSAALSRNIYEGGVSAQRSVVHHADDDGLETVALWECVSGCQVAALDAQSGECPAGTVVTRNGGGGRIFNGKNYQGPIEDGGYQDSGTASRFFPQFALGELDVAVPFFYTAKPSRAERDAGLEEFPERTGAEATRSKEGQARLDSPRTGAGRTGGARNAHPTVKPVDLMRWLVRLVTPPGGIVLDPFTGSGTTGIAAMLEQGPFRFLGIERESEYVAIAEARIRHVVGGQYRTPTAAAAEATAQPEGPPKQLGLF